MKEADRLKIVIPNMHQFIISLVGKGVFPPLEQKLSFPSPSRILPFPFILSDQIHPLGKHRRD